MSEKHCESCKCCEKLETVVEQPKKEKIKRVLSEAQKAVLAKGREKRLEMLKGKKEVVPVKEEKKEEVKEEPPVISKPVAVASQPIDIPKKPKMVIKPHIMKKSNPIGVRFVRGINHSVEF